MQLIQLCAMQNPTQVQPSNQQQPILVCTLVDPIK
jgi:hypothetical protein